ncbi:MAG: RNA-binding transcriptional accessory protein [Dysgonamonadaceae bacterium]|jgi:uncharacterized protein|nr:RNA-binding transcriptional accessory protein [Dysgonamonadaceae bacterium]
MKTVYCQLISSALGISEKSIRRTVELLDDGATIPFISRYRKEATGGLDEVKTEEIKAMYEKYQELNERKITIVKSIEEQGKLTPEISNRIENCWNAVELEDIYLPYKPKRHTRAGIARKQGLEPLAKILMDQYDGDIIAKAKQFISEEIKDADEALQGARDIIAEWINESEQARKTVRKLFRYEAVITSKAVKSKEEKSEEEKNKEEKAEKYRDYFDFSEPLVRCASHRLLAMRRGEAEGFLRVSISPDDRHCIAKLNKRFVKHSTASSEQVKIAIKDGYKRLLKPAVETEFAASSKEKADKEAIKVFAENLHQLLLAPPLGQKRVLALDPGFRTGCKLVCLDAQGNLLHNETIYPHPPQNERREARAKLMSLVQSCKIEAIAIGNGTASRETETLISNIPFDRDIKVFAVSEDGASIYSASKVAREEFPEYDVTVRGAVSIGRRLMDPLAELVKIEPKSIGVGQYQHDVNQSELKKSLDRTVENCVNRVGVNINTASKHLLTRVSGLGPALAQNIVDYRAKHGAFRSRRDLLKVPRLGEKTSEQASGFLRIPGAENPLDNTAVHPESYSIVEQMAADLNCTVAELIKNKELQTKITLDKYISDTAGLPTLTDIMQELAKPGLDPRESIKVFEFDPNVRTIDDLEEGQILNGIINNITNFGCFVDLGIKEDGLIHISNLSDRFVTDPKTVVSLHQHVRVKVMTIDYERKRIGLTMKGL